MLKRREKILLALLLATGIGISLSGCLVKKKSPDEVTTFFTSTATVLRIYQPFDTIYYRIRVDDSSGISQFGTLQLKWEDAGTLPDPFTPATLYPVLKETSTLTIDGNEDALVRYVEQDNTVGSPTEGSMYLRAFATATLGEYHWLSDKSIAPPGVLQKYEIFHSPLSMTGQIDLGNFYILGDCTGTDCPTRFAFSQTRNFEVTAINQTVDIPGIGIFKNVYTVKYNATINRDATAPLFDILDVCGAAGAITSHETTLSIVPEVGIIKMVNICTDQQPGSLSPTTIYTATLDDTSFQY